MPRCPSPSSLIKNTHTHFPCDSHSLSSSKLQWRFHSLNSSSDSSYAAMRYHIIKDNRNDPNDRGRLPAVHIKDSDDSFTVTRAFPGLGKEIVKVAVDAEKNIVSIKLRGCDGCETLVPLPESCKCGEARVVVKHGMVTVVVPKRKKGEE